MAPIAIVVASTPSDRHAYTTSSRTNVLSMCGISWYDLR